MARFGAALAQLPGPHGKFQAESRPGIGEAAAQELLELADPVPHGLRVNVESCGCLGGDAASVHERLQRFHKLPLAGWRRVRKSTELSLHHSLRQGHVGQQPQLYQMLVAANDLAFDDPLLGEAQGAACPSQ